MCVWARPAGARGIPPRSQHTGARDGSSSETCAQLTDVRPLELYTDESPGLTVDPVVVLVLSLVFIFSVVALHGEWIHPYQTARSRRANRYQLRPRSFENSRPEDSGGSGRDKHVLGWRKGTDGPLGCDVAPTFGQQATTCGFLDQATERAVVEKSMQPGSDSVWSMSMAIHGSGNSRFGSREFYQYFESIQALSTSTGSMKKRSTLCMGENAAFPELLAGES